MNTTQYCKTCGNEIVEAQYTSPTVKHNYCSSNCANGAPKAVEPIKEESQEDMAPTPIQCALEDCLLLLEEVHKDFNCLSTISLGKIEHYRKIFITGESLTRR